jgi:integrase
MPTRKHAPKRIPKLATPRASAAQPDAAGDWDDARIAALKPRRETEGKHRGELRPVKTFLGRGLFVLTTESGAHSFRFPYVNAKGKPATWTIGLHGPDLSYQQAVDEHARIRDQLEKKTPVAELRDARRSAKGDGRTLKDEIESWLAVMRPHWSPRYYAGVSSMLMRDVIAPEGVAFPLGSRRLVDIESPMVLKCVQRVEQRGALDAASDLTAVLKKIFARAKAAQSGGLTSNPAEDTHTHLAKRGKRTHFAALEADDLPRFLADIREREKSGGIRKLAALAIQMMVHTCLRTDTLRHTRREWIDLDAREIRYPHKTPGLCKVDFAEGLEPEYVVPLSDEVMEILVELESVSGHSPLLFPHRSNPEKPCSNGTWLKACNEAGWTGELDKTDPDYRPEITVHGFRSLFRTTTGEGWGTTRQREYAIEIAMDHGLEDDTLKQLKPYLRKAGTWRGLFVDERHDLMRWWSAYVAKAATASPVKVVQRPKRDTVRGGKAANAILRARREREQANGTRSQV